ncbi:MAG: hypothetical protein ACYTG0_46200 [Planctomycetota bacterium]|jgi:hypothetical protein
MNKRSTQPHTTVTVQTGSWKGEIDEEIAPLIREMWVAGIETTMSCQEDGWGLVWIMFPDEVDLVTFLNMVAEYEEGPDTLYNRMNPRWRDPQSGSAWEYEIMPTDLALVEEDHDEDSSTRERHDGVSDFFFHYSVRFPRCDLPRVVEHVTRHNRQTAVVG